MSSALRGRQAKNWGQLAVFLLATRSTGSWQLEAGSTVHKTMVKPTWWSNDSVETWGCLLTEGSCQVCGGKPCLNISPFSHFQTPVNTFMCTKQARSLWTFSKTDKMSEVKLNVMFSIWCKNILPSLIISQSHWSWSGISTEHCVFGKWKVLGIDFSI